MPLTYSLDLPIAGEDITAEKLATLFTNIREAASQVTGTDIVSGANISGAAIAVGSMPGDRLGGKSVATAQLGLQSVTNAEVFDATLKKGKLATATGDQITSAQMGDRVQTLNFNSLTTGQTVNIGGTPAIPTATYDIVGLFFNFTVPVGVTTATVERGSSGGNHVAVVRCSGSGSISGAVDIWYRPKT